MISMILLRRTSGGIFHDMLIHDFDMLDFLSGGQVPESVTSVGHCYNPEIQAMGAFRHLSVAVSLPIRHETVCF